MNAKVVRQPHIINIYNKGMGGVDVGDKLLSLYRPKLRAEMWWWNLFSHIWNFSFVAAFRFYELTYVNPSIKMTHSFKETLPLYSTDRRESLTWWPTGATKQSCKIWKSKLYPYIVYPWYNNVSPAIPF